MERAAIMTSIMASESQKTGPKAKAHSTFIRLVFPGYIAHFKSAAYLKEATLDLLDRRVCGEMLRLTAQKADVREAIGLDPKFWQDFTALLQAAVPSLERRSFTICDPPPVDYESTSGPLIASHYPGLYRDLERLNNLVSIARNILTVGEKAQDLVAECFVDQEMFRLINVCVRVTARGFDGDSQSPEEERWTWIINSYKKLLITALQFTNNLVAQNERRKLMLWVALFDSTAEGGLGDDGVASTQPPSVAVIKPEPPVSAHDVLIALGDTNRERVIRATKEDHARRAQQFEQTGDPKYREEPKISGSAWGYVLWVKQHKATIRSDFRPDASEAELADEFRARWTKDVPASDKKLWELHYENLHSVYQKDLADWRIAQSAPLELSSKDKSIAAKLEQIERQLSAHYKSEIARDSQAGWSDRDRGDVLQPDEGLVHRSRSKSPLPMDDLYNVPGPRPVMPEDYHMELSASQGAKILESGKSELMKRLESYPPPPQPSQIASPTSAIVSPSSPVYDDERTDDAEDGLEDESEEEEEEESEDEDDYPGSPEDGRGLLTDVPLILGPSEIEVLPMIVMTGIVPPATGPMLGSTKEEINAIINMHTVRCHLLLAQDNGKNLLRELLIFVAAWDLREDELYFKFMIKILEAILINGLMPYAYHAFREQVALPHYNADGTLTPPSKSRSKDIISPAQAVIMKLLTNIFRARQEASKLPLGASKDQYSNTISSYPLRVDVHIVNFLFTEFRQHIIPQTCALIFLQGKIHQNHAHPEDFPLNLWDMERMYEGVYQYLEFFAILTEHDTWKVMMADWEMASELVTLLQELDAAIPKLAAASTMTLQSQQVPACRRGQIVQQTQQQQQQLPPAQQPPPLTRAPSSSTPAPVSVERPFDLDPSPTLPPMPDAALPSAAPIFEAETPLAYPEDAQDEPSDFEWRNLKKLTVLVLSSLVWKNRRVQDQVRKYGGIETLVRCCRHDEHNPYIREHAIMCLRFAVEGCEGNAERIRIMAGLNREDALGVRGDGSEADEEDEVREAFEVPREVLDQNGYETFMDGKGQVGLRRKGDAVLAGSIEGLGRVAASASANGNVGVGKPKTTTRLTAEKAAELMQTALKDLPLQGLESGKLGLDGVKREALAKLDRAFEMSEGMGRGGNARR
ncbi:hypothetical protein LTR66_012971 [Elasticomyces elasticus]|nr:hypothetical protein LTR66_012971 [Elasticomyces elasticus]